MTSTSSALLIKHLDKLIYFPSQQGFSNNDENCKRGKFQVVLRM